MTRRVCKITLGNLNLHSGQNALTGGQWKGCIMMRKTRSHGRSVRLLLNHVYGFGQWKGAMLEGVLADTPSTRVSWVSGE